MKNKFVINFLLILLFIFVLLTFSRSLYIFFLATFILILARQKNFIVLILISVAFILSLFIIPKPFGEGVNLGRTFSIGSRLADYQTAMRIWSTQPILGVGYNHLRYAKKQLNLIEVDSFEMTHAGASLSSSFLVILTTGGILGLITFLFFLRRLAKMSPNNFYIVLFLALLSLTDNVILHPFVFFLLLTISLFSFNHFDTSR